MFKSTVLALLVAGLMAGCSLAPDYTRPSLPVANQWPDGVKPAGQRQVDNLDWHTLFPDQRLQAVIQLALDNNRDLRIAVGRVEEARAQWGVQKADRVPSLGLSVGRTASLTPSALSTTGRDFHVNRYDGDLTLLSFELDFWGRIGNLSESAKASYLSTEEARRTVRLGLIADTANAYLTLKEMEERLALTKETVRTRADMLKLISLRRDVGIAADLDYLQAQGVLETAKADMAALERQRVQASNALTLLVGASLPSNLPEGHALADQGIEPDLTAGLPSEVLLRRPDVRGAEQRLIGSNANIGAARAAFLPKIVLTGAFGSASPALSGLFKAGTEAWSYTPVMTMPLFDWGRTSGNVDVAQARKVQAVADYEKTIQSAFREVADLFVARDTLIEQLRAQQAIDKAQSERLRLVDARYKAGIASNLELLDAQRDSYTAQQNVVAVRRQLLATVAQLYKGLGGGETQGE